ncbi:unnamed protein product, partial [Trypanosoma congolense IL3000]
MDFDSLKEDLSHHEKTNSIH